MNNKNIVRTNAETRGHCRRTRTHTHRSLTSFSIIHLTYDIGAFIDDVIQQDLHCVAVSNSELCVIRTTRTWSVLMSAARLRHPFVRSSSNGKHVSNCSANSTKYRNDNENWLRLGDDESNMCYAPSIQKLAISQSREKKRNNKNLVSVCVCKCRRTESINGRAYRVSRVNINSQLKNIFFSMESRAHTYRLATFACTTDDRDEECALRVSCGEW